MNISVRCEKFGMNTDHCHSYKFWVKYCLDVKITNLGTVQNFEVVYDNINIARG